jgi:hypothetical protein
MPSSSWTRSTASPLDSNPPRGSHSGGCCGRGAPVQ